MGSMQKLGQPRVLRREWKRYKPHLPKSTSLPSLQLLPYNRPVFTCGRCGFTNTKIAICLWCDWMSQEATASFEASAPRRRRVSAPVKLLWQQTGAEASSSTKTKPRKPERNASASSEDSSLNPVTPDDIIPDIKVTANLEFADNSVVLDKAKRDRRRSRRHGLMIDHDVFNAFRASATTAPLQDSPTCAPRNKRRTPAKSLSLDFVKEHSAAPTDRQRSNIMDLTFFSPPQPPLRHHASYSTTETTHPRHFLSHSRSSLSLSAPQRTLRRKKRMTLLKQKSSRSLRTHASVPLLNAVSEMTPTNIRTPILESAMSMPQMSAMVPLGHPSRPYYTAIRPNMSRPSSPFQTPPSSRAPSPAIRHSYHDNTSYFASTRGARPVSSTRNSHPTANATVGCSMSGETEMRMALARWRSSQGQDQPAEYRFSQVEPSMVRAKTRKSPKIASRVKKMGMELLERVLGRK